MVISSSRWNLATLMVSLPANTITEIVCPSEAAKNPVYSPLIVTPCRALPQLSSARGHHVQRADGQLLVQILNTVGVHIRKPHESLSPGDQDVRAGLQPAQPSWTEPLPGHQQDLTGVPGVLQSAAVSASPAPTEKSGSAAIRLLTRSSSLISSLLIRRLLPHGINGAERRKRFPGRRTSGPSADCSPVWTWRTLARAPRVVFPVA